MGQFSAYQANQQQNQQQYPLAQTQHNNEKQQSSNYPTQQQVPLYPPSQVQQDVTGSYQQLHQQQDTQQPQQPPSKFATSDNILNPGSSSIQTQQPQQRLYSQPPIQQTSQQNPQEQINYPPNSQPSFHQPPYPGQYGSGGYQAQPSTSPKPEISGGHNPYNIQPPNSTNSNNSLYSFNDTVTPYPPNTDQQPPLRQPPSQQAISLAQISQHIQGTFPPSTQQQQQYPQQNSYFGSADELQVSQGASAPYSAPVANINM